MILFSANNLIYLEPPLLRRQKLLVQAKTRMSTLQRIVSAYLPMHGFKIFAVPASISLELNLRR